MAVGDPIATSSAPGLTGRTGSHDLVAPVRAVLGDQLGVGPDLEWERLDAEGLRNAVRSVRATISSLEHQERLLLARIAERRAFAVDGSRDGRHRAVHAAT